MCRVFEHSQAVVSDFQYIYLIHNASLQPHVLYCTFCSIIALIRLTTSTGRPECFFIFE